MPANTEWISQPAISSASSTARCIDWTVDSMLTTTPFFNPREGCEPMPSTSMEPSRPTSPTRATTFEVPMSSPTIRFLSERLSIPATVFFSTVCRSAPPSNCKPVRVAHVDIRDIAASLSDELQSCVYEFFKPFINLASPETDRHAIRQFEFPGTARIEAHRGQPQSGLYEPPLRREVTLRYNRLFTLWTRQLCELGRHVALVLREQLTARVEQPGLAPASRCYLLNHEHMEPSRPLALYAHSIDPGQRMNRVPDGIEVHAQQTGTPYLLLDNAFHINGCHTLESARN